MGWPLVIEEVEGVEVLAAIDIAVKVLRATGDNTWADHYAEVGQRLADRTMPEAPPEPGEDHDRAVYTGDVGS